MPDDDDGDDDDPQDSVTLASLRQLEREAADNGNYETAREYANEADALEEKLYPPDRPRGVG